MPKNINCITIIITLEGIEKIKTENNDNTAVYDNHASVYKLNGFHFPTMKIHHREKLARNYKILPFEFSKIMKDMKGRSELI